MVAAAVGLATAALMMLHLAVSPPAPAGRDALMFRGDADTLRVMSLRTDFASFYYAGKAAAKDLNIYDAFTLDSLAALDGISNHVLPYLYPPFLAVVSRPLAEMNPLEAQRAWDYVQVILATLSAILLCLTMPWRGAGSIPDSYWVRAGSVTLAGILMLPFGQNIAFGQVNIAVLFFLSLSFYFLYQGKSDWLAGIALAAAILIKVTPALIAVFFLLGWRWKALTATLIGMGLLILATFDIAGREAWGYFLQFVPNMGFARNVDGGFHPSIVANFSLAGFFMRILPGQGTLVRIFTMMSILILFVALLFHQLKYRDKRGGALFVLPYLVLMVISSPVSWLHHLVYLLPGVVFALRDFKFAWRPGIWFLVLVSLIVFASFDYLAIYSSMSVAEEIRPFVTSLNLYILLAAFFVSLRVAAGRSSLLVTG